MAILTILRGDDANLKLEAGDDAEKAKWTDYHLTKSLFASHKLFIDLAVAEMVRRCIVKQDESKDYYFII